MVHTADSIRNSKKSVRSLIWVTGLSLLLVQGTDAHLAFGAFDNNHTAWKKILDKHVEQKGSLSFVNYVGIKNEKKELTTYLGSLTEASVKDYKSFSEQEKLTFLINAYNAFTILLIVDHYPVKSIKDIGSVFKSPWSKKFFKLFGEEKTLDNIEQDIIRKEFNEPRIHLALVCASKGCPGLRWYNSKELDTQLDVVTNTYLKDVGRNISSVEKKELKISKIFDWYGKDFVKKFGSVKAFIAPRIAKNDSEKSLILSEQTKVAYFDYDWSLNEKK